jgi:hypothetical protein
MDTYDTSVMRDEVETVQAAQTVPDVVGTGPARSAT